MILNLWMYKRGGVTVDRKYGKVWILCLAVLAAALAFRPWTALAETAAVSESQTALKLEDLSLEPVAIDFQPDIYEYSIAVPEETEKVLVKAAAADGITYTVNGNDNLQMGENLITVRLAGESGETAEYVIHVNRGDLPSSVAEETAAATAAASQSAAETPAVSGTDGTSGFWEKFSGFITGNRTVLAVFGVLLLAVILLIAVIVLLFKSGVKRTEKQKEEEEFRRKKEALEKRIAEKKQKKPEQKTAEEIHQKTETDEDDDFDIIDL